MKLSLEKARQRKEKDASRKQPSLRMKRAVRRMSTAGGRRSRSGNTNHAFTENGRVAYSDLKGLSDSLAIPSALARKAAYIYRRALLRGLNRGRSISALVAASVYAACRYAEMFRTLKDVSSASQVQKREIARCYRLLVKELNMRMPLEDPIKCVVSIAKNAGVSEAAQRRAIQILGRARKLGVMAGKNPVGLAAAALRVACEVVGEEKKGNLIVKAASVTDVTIRNRGKGLREALGMELKSSL